MSHLYGYLIGIWAGEATSEAVSKSESAEFPLDKLESEDTWSLVFLELPLAVSSLGSPGPVVGLEEGQGTLIIVAQSQSWSLM